MSVRGSTGYARRIAKRPDRSSSSAKRHEGPLALRITAHVATSRDAQRRQRMAVGGLAKVEAHAGATPTERWPLIGDRRCRRATQHGIVADRSSLSDLNQQLPPHQRAMASAEQAQQQRSEATWPSTASRADPGRLHRLNAHDDAARDRPPASPPHKNEAGHIRRRAWTTTSAKPTGRAATSVSSAAPIARSAASAIAPALARSKARHRAA